MILILFLIFFSTFSVQYYDEIITCNPLNDTFPLYPSCSCLYECSPSCQKKSPSCQCPIIPSSDIQYYTCSAEFIEHIESFCFGISEYSSSVCSSKGVCKNGYCKCDSIFYVDGTECEMFVGVWVEEFVNEFLLLSVFIVFVTFCVGVFVMYYCFLYQPIEKVIVEVKGERKKVDELLVEFVFIKNVFLNHGIVKEKILKDVVKRKCMKCIGMCSESELVEAIEKQNYVKYEKIDVILKEYFKRIRKDQSNKTNILNSFKNLENILFYKRIEKVIIISFIINLYFKVLDYLLLSDDDDDIATMKKYSKYFDNFHIILKKLENKCNEFYKLHNKLHGKKMNLFNEYDKNITKNKNVISEYKKVIDGYKNSMKINVINKNVDLKRYAIKPIKKDLKSDSPLEGMSQMLISDVDLQEYEEDDVLLDLKELENDAKRKVNTIQEYRIENEQKNAEELLDKIYHYVEINSDSDVKYYCSELLEFLKQHFFVVDTPYSLLDRVMKILELISEVNENNDEKVIIPCLNNVLKIMNISLFYQKITEEAINESKRDKFFHILNVFKERFKSNYLIQHKLRSVSENLKLIKDASSLSDQILSSIKLFDYSEILLLLKSKLSQISEPTSYINYESWYKTSLSYILKEQSMILELNKVKIQSFFKHNVHIKLHLLEIIEKKCIELFEKHVQLKTLFKKMKKDNPEIVNDRTFTVLCQLIPSADLENLREIKFSSQSKEEKESNIVDNPLIKKQSEGGINLKKTDEEGGIIVSVEEKPDKESLDEDELSEYFQYFNCLNRFDKKTSKYKNVKKNDYELLKEESFEESFLDYIITENLFTLLQFKKYWNAIQQISRIINDTYIQILCIRADSKIINKIGQKSTNYNFIEERIRKIKKSKVRNYLLEEIERSILSENKWFTFEKFINEVCVNINFLELQINLTGKPLSSFQTSDDRELTVAQLFEEIEEKQNILFKGSGGSGKSCLLRYFCHAYAKQKKTFPIFIKADIFVKFSKEWVKSSLEKKVDILVESIINSQYSELYSNFTSTQITELTFELKEICKNESLILVLDGFDEVSDIQKNVFSEFLKALVKESEIEIEKLFISSRFIKEIETGFFKSQFEHYRINPLSHDNSRKLVENILVNQGFNKEIILPRFDKVRKKLLEQNPLISVLILKRLLNTEKKDDDDITNRSKLYTGILYSSITEDKQRKKHSDTSVANCSNVFLMNLLSIISYILHRTQDQTKNNIVNILNQHLDIVCDTEKWLMSVKNPLESMIESLISFTSLCSQQKDFVIFSHRTIQEFFAARFICNPDDNQNMNKLLKYFNENDNLYYSFYFETKSREEKNHWSNVYEFYNLFHCSPFENIENIIFYRMLFTFYLNKINYPSKSAYFFDELRKKIFFSSVYEKEREKLKETDDSILKSFLKLSNEGFKTISKDIKFDNYKEELLKLLSLRNLGEEFYVKVRKIITLLDCFYATKMLLINFPKFFRLTFQLNNSFRELLDTTNIHQNCQLMNYLEYSLRVLDAIEEDKITAKQKKHVFKNLHILLYYEIKNEIENCFGFDKIVSKMISKISLRYKKDVFNLFLSHLLFSNYDYQKTRFFFQKERVFLDFDQYFVGEKSLFQLNGNYDITNIDRKNGVIEVFSNKCYYMINLENFNDIIMELPFSNNKLTTCLDKEIFNKLEKSKRIQTLRILDNIFKSPPGILKENGNQVVKILSSSSPVFCFREKMYFHSTSKIVDFVFDDMAYCVWREHVYFLKDSSNIFLICKRKEQTDSLFLKNEPSTVYFCVITGGKFKVSLQKYEKVLENKFFYYKERDMLIVNEENFLFYLKRTSTSLTQIHKKNLFEYSGCYDHSFVITKIYDSHWQNVIIIQDIKNNFVAYNIQLKITLFNYLFDSFNIEERLQFYYIESSKCVYIKHYRRDKTIIRLISLLKKPEKDLNCTKINFDYSEFHNLCVKNPYHFFLMRKTDDFHFLQRTLYKSQVVETKINSQLEELRGILIRNQKQIEDILLNKQQIQNSGQNKTEKKIKNLALHYFSDLFGNILDSKSKTIPQNFEYHYYEDKKKVYFFFEDETQLFKVKMYNDDGSTKFSGDFKHFEKNTQHSLKKREEEERFFDTMEEIIFFAEEQSSKKDYFWSKKNNYDDLSKTKDVKYLGDVLLGKKVYFSKNPDKVRFEFIKGSFEEEIDDTDGKESFFWHGTGIEYDVEGNKLFEGEFGSPYGSYKKGILYENGEKIFEGDFSFTKDELTILKQSRRSFCEQEVHVSKGILYRDGKKAFDGKLKYYNSFFTNFYGLKEMTFDKVMNTFHKSSDFIFANAHNYFIPINGKVFVNEKMIYDGEIIDNHLVNGKFYGLETGDFICEKNLSYLYKKDLKEIKKNNEIHSFIYTLDGKRVDYYTLNSIFFKDPLFSSKLKNILSQENHFLVKKKMMIHDIGMTICYFYFNKFEKIFIGKIENKENRIIFKDGIFYNNCVMGKAFEKTDRKNIMMFDKNSLELIYKGGLNVSTLEMQGNGERRFVENGEKKIYRGEFLNNQFSGDGTIILEKTGNKIYQGKFKHDKYHGNGKVYNGLNGNLLFVSQFRKSKPVGICKEYAKDGKTFVEKKYYNGDILKGNKVYFLDKPEQIKYELIKGAFLKFHLFKGVIKEYNKDNKLVFDGLSDQKGRYKKGKLYNGNKNPIYIGTFNKKGEYDVQGEIYDKETSKLLYKGKLKNNSYVEGSLYSKKTHKLIYSGCFDDDGVYDKKGDLYDEKTGFLMYSGGWKHGNHFAIGKHYDKSTGEFLYKREIFSEDYYTGKAKVSDKDAKDEDVFCVFDKVEAIDKLNPKLTCVATICQIRNDEMKIHFDGWTDKYDYWVKMNECESLIFLINTCKEKNAILQPPRSYGKEFVWEEYLKEEKSRSSPKQCWRKDYISEVQDDGYFKVGMKIEAIDKLNPHLTCVASICKIKGKSMLVHFDGWSARFDYMIDMNNCGEFVFPIGYCEKNSKVLQKPNRYAKDTFVWSEYLEETNSIAAPVECWEKEYTDEEAKEVISKVDNSDAKVGFDGFQVNDKVEAVDKANPSMICVASIIGISDGKVKVTFDGWGHGYDYFETPDTYKKFIFPIGHCKKNNKSLQPPNKYGKPFVWENYLNETGARAAPENCFL